MTSSHWIRFLSVVFILAAIHTVTCAAAYAMLKKTISEPATISERETVSSGQQASGEVTVILTQKQVFKHSIPSPLLYYTIFGYLGLATSLAIAIYTHYGYR
jgi:hypothetical protein